MEELLPRNEALDHIEHFGKNDPNLIIYNHFLKTGQEDKARRYKLYRETWEAVRKGVKTSDIPLFVTFSLNDSCNLLCAHCYRRFNKTRTPRRRLSIEDFKMLIDQCQELGVPSIGLGTECELFLHEQIEEAINYVSDRDFLDFWIMTNGLLLTDEKIKTILDSNATRLTVSLDAISNDTFRKVRGKGFYRIMSNIFKFLEEREKRQTTLPILRVSFIDYNLNTHECSDFINFWSRIADEVDTQSLIDVKNIDLLKYSEISPEKVKCNYPNNMLYINWNGDYKPCCSEFCKHLTIGNISSMGIMEAWNSGYINDLRSQLAGASLLNKICMNCLSSFHSKENYEPLVSETS